MEATIDKFTSTGRPPLIEGIPPFSRELEALNGLLRGELSAVETYDQCIDALDDETIVGELEALRRSHEIRREQIHHHIQLLGGEPDESSGAWGLFARALETGAALLGAKPALEVLERGELHGLRAYHETDELQPETMAFLVNHLRPEQARTRAKVSELLRRVS